MTNLLTSFYGISIGTAETGVLPLKMGVLWLGFGISFAIILGLYALRSVGLFVLAKKQGIKNYGLAFVPVVWIYIACKLAGNTRFFNKPIEKLALIFCIIFAVAELLTFAYNFIVYYPLFDYLVFNGGKIIIGTASQAENMFQYLSIDETTGIFVANEILPFGLSIATTNKILDVIYYLSNIFDLASIVITVTVYINLFRRFWPQHYMLASLLSVFLGLFPIFVFVIRNKPAINYADYMRSRYQNFNPNNNPYNNPYNNGNNGYGAPSGQTPFEDFEDKKNKKPEEPFKDFDNKKDPFDEF